MKNRIIIFLSLLFFTSQIGCKAQISTKDDILFIDNKKCGRLLYNKNGEKPLLSGIFMQLCKTVKKR